MAKPKNPLLSLEAQGTIGDTLTYQKRGQDTIVRQKPIPKDPYSLNQAYQRWDYRDYAYLWTLLTNSEKQIYRTKASRYHITGFSQFMRENLKDLTDIAGRWHLDEKSGAIAYDSSRQGNNGVIVGASPAAGLINGGFHFDGINDMVTFDNPASLSNFTELTLSIFLKVPAFVGWTRGIIQGGYWVAPFGLQLWAHAIFNTLRLFIKNTLGVVVVWNFAFTPDTWLHLAMSWDGSNARLYLDGLLWRPPDAFTGTLACTGRPLILGFMTRYTYGDFTADHFVIHRRALDATEILRLSQRRYPV